MNAFERRIKNSRPQGAVRNSPLSRRARADFEHITGRAYDERYNRPKDQRSQRKRTARTPRLLISATVLAAVVLAIGVFAITQIDRPSRADAVADSSSDAIADSESEGTDQPAVAQSYEDIQALAEAADLVIVGRVDGSLNDQDDVTVVEVNEVLASTDADVASVHIRLDPVDADGQAPLADIDADKLILFLTASDEPGLYTLTQPTQSIIGVAGDTIYPVFDDVDMNGLETLDQLRTMLQGR